MNTFKNYVLFFKKFFTPSARFFFLQTVLVSFIYTCQANSEHYEYWKNFFMFQDTLKNFLKQEKTWELANGNLNPNSESKLQKLDSQKLALLYMGNFFDSKFQIQKMDLNNEVSFSNFENYLFIEYNPTKYRDLETYIFKRTIQFQASSVYHTTDFLEWIYFFQSQKNKKEFFLSSPLGKFLCEIFDCEFKLIGTSFIQTFKPNKNLQKLDKSFYTRIVKLLDSSFELRIFEKGNHFLNISNQNKTLEFKWNQNLISKNPEKIKIDIYFTSKFYGLTIEIQNWIYELEFGRAGRSSYLKGKFVNIPKYELSGRIGYIFPKQVLNLFIPENIDEYLKNFFELRLRGNSGKGNLWEVQVKPYYKHYRMTSIVESESPRKLFRFWSFQKSPDSEIFEEKFKLMLINSLYQ